MTDLTAKARRAAEWLNANGFEAWQYGRLWQVGKPNPLTHAPADKMLNSGYDKDLIAFAEDRGWQDQDSKPPEFVEVKGVESATFDHGHEHDADGVEWETKTIDSTMIGKLMVVARVEPDGSHTWSVWDNETWDEIASADGTAPTRAEARRQAVEAARGMR